MKKSLIGSLALCLLLTTACADGEMQTSSSKTCNDDSTCTNGELQTSTGKTCKDDSTLCATNEKCNDKEICEVKSCKERCGDSYCAKNDECYSQKEPESGSFNAPIICNSLTIPNDVNYLLKAVEETPDSDNTCQFYDKLKAYYNENETAKVTCKSSPMCGSPGSFAYCDKPHQQVIVDIMMRQKDYEYDKTTLKVTASTITKFNNIIKGCPIEFDD